MTRYELWTMDSKRLVQGLENACFALAHDPQKKAARRAMEIAEGEILRRLQILVDMEEEEEWRE